VNLSFDTSYTEYIDVRHFNDLFLGFDARPKDLQAAFRKQAPQEPTSR